MLATPTITKTKSAYWEGYFREVLSRLEIPPKTFVPSIETVEGELRLRQPEKEFYCRPHDIFNFSALMRKYKAHECILQFEDPPGSPFEYPFDHSVITIRVGDLAVLEIRDDLEIIPGDILEYHFKIIMDGKEVDPVIIVGE
jgi:hypothetical protein